MKQKRVFAFDRMNFILLGIGMAAVILGLILMSGSGSNFETFNVDIFSARRIKVVRVGVHACAAGFPGCAKSVQVVLCRHSAKRVYIRLRH